MHQRIETTHFGAVAWDPAAAIEFPAGLPAFENERGFVPLEMSGCAPLVFLQSLTTPELCFLALPVKCLEPEYRLELQAEESARIGLDPRRPPEIGRDVLALALVTVGEDGITANLRAPLVVALEGRRAVQSIQPEGRYSHRHVLDPPPAGRGEQPCS